MKKIEIKMKLIRKFCLFFVFTGIAIYLINSLTSRVKNLKTDILNIEVFYETRCPDSADFLMQFGSLRPSIFKYLNITLKPFGKASVRENYFFSLFQFFFFLSTLGMRAIKNGILIVNMELKNATETQFM